MAGDVGETYLSELQKRDSDDSQQSLFEFSPEEEQKTTTIAVVSAPTGGIRDATDEFIPALGMPKEKLKEFQSLRAQLKCHNPVEEHNRAFDKCDLESEYRNYLENTAEARDAVSKLVERLGDGENITLVCFEKPPKRCHRHILADVIEAQMSKNL